MATESPIGDIFSDNYRFSIPLYQRPYAWTIEEAGEMLDDLLAAALAESSVGDTDPYFLGRIVLVKSEDSADSEVIDGQQRLTTLTILLSVARQFVPEKYHEPINGYLYQKGNPLRDQAHQPRLKLREQDRSFFEKHIQDPQGVATIRHRVTDNLSESQRNIVDNARLYWDRLSELSPEECLTLVGFIDQRTYLVTVATQDFESAYRIFTVLNERGLELTVTDILKAEVIGAIPAVEQDVYRRRWEDEEEDLGRDEFQKLFSHIRMVFAKTKAREAIVKAFRVSVLERIADPRKFVDDVLVPYANAYEIATNASYRSPTTELDVNQPLRWLNRLDNFDWIAPAIRYLREDRVPAPMLHRFLVDLERLAASMLIRRVDLTRRVERYGAVINAIDQGADLYRQGSPLQLVRTERIATMERLADDIYSLTRVRLYVLLRLDSALSAGGATYDYPIITVEHVLPQNPPVNSQWRQWFPDEEREQWVHRLANLVLLSRRKNSEASNYDFATKKQTYFRSRSGVVPFVLTGQVMPEAEWRPAQLEKRQESLLAALKQEWRLAD